MFLRTTFFTALLCCYSTIVYSSSNYSEFFTAGVDYLDWQETPSPGRDTHLWGNEQGGMASIGYTYGTDWNTHWGLFYRHSQKMYGGGTSHTLEGSSAPEDPEGYSLHVGFDYARTWGYRYYLKGDFSIAPTLSLGIDGLGKGPFGSRSSSSNNDDSSHHEDHEFLITAYSKAGIIAAKHLDTHRRISLHAGIYQPLITGYYHQATKVKRPTNETGGYLRLEYSNAKKEGHFFSLDYTQRKFGETKQNSDGWYQPTTTRDTIGLTFGWYL